MSEKNGGPYTKPEQEERRNKVYEMHFVKSQSAIQIAEALGVNRHTISEDIRHWYSELASEFDQLEIRDLFLKQHSRLEEQRARLVSLLEKQQDVSIILKIERMIFDVEKAISKIIVPILDHAEKISEKEALDVAVHLLIQDQNVTGYSYKKMLQDITQYKNCDIIYAQKILDKIMGLGLELYKYDDSLIDTNRYDLLGFAESRNILSSEKLQQVYTKIEQKEQAGKEEIESLLKRDRVLKEKYVAKYGPEENWGKKIWAEFDAESDGYEPLP